MCDERVLWYQILSRPLEIIAYYSTPGVIIDSWSGCLEDDGTEFVRRNYTVTDAGYYSKIKFSEGYQRLFFLPSTACHNKGLEFVMNVIKVLKNETLSSQDILSKMKYLRDEYCEENRENSEETFVEVTNYATDKSEKTTTTISQSSSSSYAQSTTVVVSTTQIITSVAVSTLQTSTTTMTLEPNIKYNFVNILTGNMSESDLNMLVMSLFLTCLVLIFLLICCFMSHFKCVKKLFIPLFYRKSNSITDFKRAFHDSDLSKVNI